MANANGIRVLRTFIEIGLTGVLAFMVAKAIWSLAAAPAPPAPSAALIGFQDGPDRGIENPDKYKILTLTNPFAVKNIAQTAADVATRDAPETSLNLVLKGSRAVGDKLGIAVIALPDNSQIRAEVGDELLDGVVLEYIFTDRVTLRRGGRLENLFMRDGDSQVILPAGSAVERGAERAVSRRAASSTQAVSVTQFWKNVQLQTVRENGVRVGYRVLARGGDTQILNAAGFQPNDIIRAVNSTRIVKLGNEDLQRVMGTDRPVEFEVERNGQTVRVQTSFSRGDTP